MINQLITSKTRIRILLKFFLNCQTRSYIRSLESEFGTSTNAIRTELNQMEKAGLLSSLIVGNKKMFYANTRHPLFNDIRNILLKSYGIDQINEQITNQIIDLQAAYLTGDFAIGKDSSIIDLTLVGNLLNSSFIETLVKNAELKISRRINYIIVSKEEMIQFYKNKPVLQIWKQGA